MTAEAKPRSFIHRTFLQERDFADPRLAHKKFLLVTYIMVTSILCLGLTVYNLTAGFGAIAWFLFSAGLVQLFLLTQIRRLRRLYWLGLFEVSLLAVLILYNFLKGQNLFALSIITMVPSIAVFLLGIRTGTVFLLLTTGYLAWLSFVMAPQLYYLVFNSFTPQALQLRTFYIPVFILLALAYLIAVLYEFTINQTFAAYLDEKDKESEAESKRAAAELRLSNNLLFMESLLENLPLPVWYTDISGKIIGYNSAFSSFLGLDRASILGRSMDQLAMADENFSFDDSDQIVLAGGFTSIETRIRHADGQFHDIVGFKSPNRNARGEVIGITATLYDMSQKKSQERELLALNETRNKLFAVIGHDLRSPVGKIQQFLAYYQDQREIFDAATWDTLFADLRKSADGLKDLLDNLFMWINSQQGRMVPHPEHLPLQQIFDDVINLFRTAASTKEINLTQNNLITHPVFQDRNMLSTVVRNLVGNSLKFTPRGGSVGLVGRENSQGELLIEIIDTGIGIPEDKLPNLFKAAATKTSFGTEKEKGTGFGLALCSDLAAAMGGTIEVKSQVGEGSTFTLRLPGIETLEELEELEGN